MILILSAPDDHSTSSVIDWLIFMEKKFLRISFNDEVQFKKVLITNNCFDCILLINNLIEIKVSEIQRFWYRRSNFNLFIRKLKEDVFLKFPVDNHLRQEATIVLELFIEVIKKKSLNIPNDNYINKLNVLKKASEIGLKVPNTLVTSDKKEVIDFYFNNNRKIITKNISGGVFLKQDDYILTSFTKRVKEKMMNELLEKFNYTLFQEEVNKEFELRIFFIKNFFFASAIFSQADNKTKVDFRNYNFNKPNRTPPFKLPLEIEQKLNILMKKLKLTSGSIDMMFSKSQEYYFLEVNPIGQFSQVSRPCNYYLEKKIAEFL